MQARSRRLEFTEAARVVKVASEQVGLALKDSEAAVGELSHSLAKLADALAADLPEAQRQRQIAMLRTEMARAVTGLQFYDRMTQHLAHVQQYLERAVQPLQNGQQVSPEAWDELHRSLSGRLLSETHRMYLGRNFLQEQAEPRQTSRQERGASSPGDIDLF